MTETPTFDATRPDFDRKSLVGGMSLVIAIAPIMFLVLPLYIGAIAERTGWEPAQLGLLGSADLAGMLVATLSGLYWVPRWNWRRVALAGITIIIAGNLLSMGVGDFETLFGVRLLTGVGSGLIAAIYAPYIGCTRNPDRIAGIGLVLQAIVAAIGIQAIPRVIAAWGVDGAYGFMAAMAGVMALSLIVMPSRGIHHVNDEPEDSRAKPWPGIAVVLTLAAIVIFFTAQGGFWSFLERLGEARGTRAETIVLALTVQSAAAILGPTIAATLGDRFGRRLPIGIAVSIQLLSIILLAGVLPAWGFILFLFTFQLGWSIQVPYHYGVLASADKAGRFMVLITVFQVGGLALGPALAGGVVEGYGYTAMVVAVGILLAIYYGVVLGAIRSSSQPNAAPVTG